jgi:hypothetical protein
MRCSGFILLFLLSLLGSCQSKMKQDPPLMLTPEKDFLRKGVHDTLKHLFPILDSIFYMDQRYRKYRSADTIEKYSYEIRKTDSINLKKVIPIVERYGILGMGDIGAIGYYAITMTIQHADLVTQEKYLPYYKEALLKGRITGSTYAMLVDRIEVRNKRMQIYGTQVMRVGKKKLELYPVINIDSINERRLSIRLIDPIEKYLKTLGVEWDIESYRKELPTLNKKYGIVKGL